MHSHSGRGVFAGPSGEVSCSGPGRKPPHSCRTARGRCGVKPLAQRGSPQPSVCFLSTYSVPTTHVGYAVCPHHKLPRRFFHPQLTQRGQRHRNGHPAILCQGWQEMPLSPQGCRELSRWGAGQAHGDRILQKQMGVFSLYITESHPAIFMEHLSWVQPAWCPQGCSRPSLCRGQRPDGVLRGRGACR